MSTVPLKSTRPSLSLHPVQAPDLPVPGEDPWRAHPEDPALTVMTDFRERHSVTVPDGSRIDDALDHMKHAGVRCAFVTNDARRVVGLITAYDIMSEKPVRFVQSFDGERKDVEVRDIMLKLADWRTVDVGDLEAAVVADVHALFESTRLTHIPVMEAKADEPAKLRGLLSAAYVRRLLGK